MSILTSQTQQPLPIRKGRTVPFSSVTQAQMNPSHKPLLEAHIPSIEDDFFHPKNSLTANHVMGVFSAGLAVTLLALNLKTLLKWTRPISKSAQQALQKNATAAPNTVLGKDQIHKLETNISSQFGNPYDKLSPSYRIALLNPVMRAAVACYIATMIFGYLGSNLARGIQEAWVRRQETLIRANLIHKLRDKFKQSIQIKQDMDTELRRNTETQLYQLLLENGIPKQTAHNLVMGIPVIEPKNMQQIYAYYPITRTLTPQQLKRNIPFGFKKFGVLTPPHTPEVGTITTNEPPVFLEQLTQHKLLNAGLFGMGTVAGSFIHQFSKLFTRKAPVEMIPHGTVVREYETILISSIEAWWLKSFGKHDQMLVLAGFLGMTGLAKLGKLFVDGVREVEVTRRNARTEFLYQTHNWLMQDPAFHQIAEEEAVKHELTLLKEQFPYLSREPEKLQERIMVILSNIGRNSAPKYFAMTPPVNLVDARG